MSPMLSLAETESPAPIPLSAQSPTAAPAAAPNGANGPLRAAPNPPPTAAPVAPSPTPPLDLAIPFLPCTWAPVAPNFLCISLRRSSSSPWPTLFSTALPAFLTMLPTFLAISPRPSSTVSSSSLPALAILLRTAPATRSPAALLPYSLAALAATALKPVVALLCLPSSRSLSCAASGRAAMLSNFLFRLWKKLILLSFRVVACRWLRRTLNVGHWALVTHW